jgi:hypothetical protein
MSEASVNLLMREFLSWIDSRPRTYSQTMEAWQSTCPRHTIWEDAVLAGYVEIRRQLETKDPAVTLTSRGAALLNGYSTRR